VRGCACVFIIAWVIVFVCAGHEADYYCSCCCCAGVSMYERESARARMKEYVCVYMCVCV